MLPIAVILLAASTVLSAQGTGLLNHDPQAAVVSVSDIVLFWKAYDAWAKDGAKEDRLAAVLQSEYLDRASPGVRDFTPNRIVSADELARRILSDRAYYEAVRPHTEKVLVLEPRVRDLYRRFKSMYRDAAFPALYFVIGRRNSGGMSSARALVIGAEMFGVEGARLRQEDMVPMVAHELMHFQQQTAPAAGSSMLGTCMREGAADFLAEQLVGRHTNEAIRAYGDAHEHELWPKFQRDLQRPDGHRLWLYNLGDKTRTYPPDLGYYMGYKITQAYFQRARDRAAALRMIIEMRDPQKLMQESGYHMRFGN